MPFARFDKLPDARREAILEAAICEFAARGYERASLNQILAKAGTSKGAAYYYFADKEDLYLTVMEHVLAVLSGEVGAPDDFGGVSDARSFWRALTKTYLSVAGAFAEHGEMVALVRRDLDRLTGFGAHPRMAKYFLRAKTWVNEVLSLGRRVGALRSDLPDGLVIELSLSVGQAGDRYMIASGEVLSLEGRRVAVDRTIALLKRLFSP